MPRFFLSIMAIAMVAAAPSWADLQKVNTQTAFVNLVQGKTLTRPFVKLEVRSNGQIRGRGAKWDVTGKWSWKNGYFCRSLEWGGDDLGYNCQEVRASDGRIRFTSDQGSGDSAEFRLR